MRSLVRDAVLGAAAGAVGTAALNATTHLDMALRGRPASSTPEQTAERLASVAHVSLAEDPQKREARASGLGALLGTGAGVSVGVVLGVLGAGDRSRSAAGTTAAAFALAMLAGNAPMTVLGVTDPRTWRPVDWAADIVPHLAYAAATAATLRTLQDRRRWFGETTAIQRHGSGHPGSL